MSSRRMALCRLYDSATDRNKGCNEDCSGRATCSPRILYRGNDTPEFTGGICIPY
ncbi:MAG: hypothetical protein ABIP39_01940 [Polyangiaceae bacterium]